MELPERIEYVELSYTDSGDTSSSFWFERIARATLPIPEDDPAHRHNFHRDHLCVRRPRAAHDRRPAR